MTGESWKIYWNEYAMDTWLYGSEIHFHSRDDVEFKNALMPPGTVIKRWYSKTNYQMMRTEPSLPLIDGEGRYHISADITDVESFRQDNVTRRRKKPAFTEADGWLLKLVFYDRYDGEAGSRIIRGGQADFQCPLKTYSYELQLINAGTTGFHFHSVTITELTDGEQTIIQDTKKSKKKNRAGSNAQRRRAARKDR